MRVRRLHRFDLTPKEGVALQRRLAAHVRTTGTVRGTPRRIAAVDCAPSRDGRLHAVAVVCEAPDWEVVEVRCRAEVPPMPYVPGLLSFREIPAVLEALGALRSDADLLLVDGHGRAHPRRIGIAAHLGLHVDLPTIGVGKSRLAGAHDEPARRRGASAPLTDAGERIGTVLRTREGVKPVYVSVGNRIGLRPAARLVLAATTRFRLPDPVRHADRLSKALARGHVLERDLLGGWE